MSTSYDGLALLRVCGWLCDQDFEALRLNSLWVYVGLREGLRASGIHQGLGT